jgi:hypothetical protein
METTAHSLTTREAIAGFYPTSRNAWLVEICGYIVAEFKTANEAADFCDRHHAGFLRNA